jgi:hypothetical protein
MSMLEHALAYAREGWPVFPVRRDKTPLTKHGFKDATTDEGQVRGWWGTKLLVGDEHLPNIALAIPEGLVVLDFDPRNGAPMPGALGLGTDTRRCVTPNGGYHVYYKYDGPPLRATWMPGIDIKQAGKGYVLLPPSVDERGRKYEWWRTLHIKTLPTHIAALLLKKEPTIKVESVTASRPMFPWERATPYGEVALKNQLAKMSYAKEGERNNTLTAVGFVIGQLVGGGELKESVLHDLLKAAENTGLEREEIMHTLRGAYARGLDDPRSAPSNGE